MKTLLRLLLLLLPTVEARSAIQVTDLSVLAQVIQQVSVAADQLEKMTVELERLGDPAKVRPPAAIDLMLALGEEGKAKTLDEIQRIASGVAAFAYTAHGLYRAPGEVVRGADGTVFQRAESAYRRFDAVTRARKTLERVFEDTEARRQTLRSQIQRTVLQLQVATTESEVAKLHALLTAQNAELSTIDRERDAATGRVLVQQIENQTDLERQGVARREERRAAFRVAQQRLSEVLTPDSSIVRIPDPNRP